MAKNRQTITSISNSEIDSLARFLLPVIRNFMADENNQQEFEAWQAAKKLKLNNNIMNTEKAL